MEPGLRWLRCWPCEAPTPANPWRFMTPAVPLPLEVPTTFDLVAGLEDRRVDLLAERVLRSVEGAQLNQVTAQGRAGLLEVALQRLGDLAGIDLPVGDLHRVVAVGLDGTDLGDDVRPVCTTVTGTSFPFSSQTCVMPSLVPSTPDAGAAFWPVSSLLMSTTLRA